MENLLVYGVLGVAIVLVLVEGLVGYLRGWKGSLYRLGTLLLIGLILVFLVPNITEAILVAVCNKLQPGHAFPSLRDVLVFVVQENADLGNPALLPVINLIAGVGIAVCIPYFFVAFYWLCKLVSLPVYELVRKLIQKKQNREVAPEPKSSRLIGLGIGVVCGILLGALSFMPAGKLAVYVDTANEGGQLAGLVKEEAMSYLSFWNKTPARFLYRYTGTEGLFGAFGNALAKAEVDGREYRADRELTELLQLVPDVVTLYTASQETGEKPIGVLSAPVTKLAGDYFTLTAISPEEKLELVHYLINLAYEKVSGTEPGMLAKLKTLPEACITALEALDCTRLEQDVNGILALAVELEEAGITKALSGNLSELPLELFTPEVNRNLAVKLYQLNIAEKIVPLLVNTGLDLVLEPMGVAVVYPEKVEDFANTTNDFILLLDSLPELAGLTNRGNAGVGDAAQLLGKLKVLKESPFITAQTYENIQAMALKEMDLYIKSTANLPGVDLSKLDPALIAEVDVEKLDTEALAEIDWSNINEETAAEIDWSKIDPEGELAGIDWSEVDSEGVLGIDWKSKAN